MEDDEDRDDEEEHRRQRVAGAQLEQEILARERPYVGEVAHTSARRFVASGSTRAGSWVETRNGISNFDTDLNPAHPAVIVAKDGSRLDRALTTTDFNNVVPRFGFAYTANPKTVFRGGYGIFVGNYEGTGGGRHLLGNPPNTIAV